MLVRVRKGDGTCAPQGLAAQEQRTLKAIYDSYNINGQVVAQEFKGDERLAPRRLSGSEWESSRRRNAFPRLCRTCCSFVSITKMPHVETTTGSTLPSSPGMSCSTWASTWFSASKISATSRSPSRSWRTSLRILKTFHTQRAVPAAAASTKAPGILAADDKLLAQIDPILAPGA